MLECRPFQAKLLERLVLFLAGLFPVPLPGQGRFYALFLAGFQVEGMPLHFFDDVLSLDFTFETAEGIL